MPRCVSLQAAGLCEHLGSAMPRTGIGIWARIFEVSVSVTSHTRWLVFCHSSRCQTTLGRVLLPIPLHPTVVTVPSGALASSQLRDPLEFVADHQAVTLVAAQISITDGVELLLTFCFSLNFLFRKSVRVFNVILILSCCQQDSVPTAAFRHASDTFG